MLRFLFRHSLEIKLKRLKQEYIDLRTELYSRMEENQSLQYELIECRLTAEYYSHMNGQSPASDNAVSREYRSNLF